MLAFANITTAVIGFIGVFAYIVLYTMITKRRYVSNTIVGSISGAVPPLIGWAAVDPNLDVLAWVLFAIMFLWQPPHFYALAMKRVEEYRAANVPMLPVVKGFKATKRSILLWVTTLLFVPFFLTPLGTPLVVLAAILGLGWFILGIKRSYNERRFKMGTYYVCIFVKLYDHFICSNGYCNLNLKRTG